MLTMNPETVCRVVVKAREFDAKVPPVEPDPGSNPSDDMMGGVLEDYGDDPVLVELRTFIGDLNVDEQVELVALAWLGRGTYGAGEWEEAVAEARRAHNEHTAGYLLGMPMIADYLEEGLSQMGHSCDDFEHGRL